MAKPVLAVDLDEVIGHFVPALATFHNDNYGEIRPPAQLPGEDRDAPRPAGLVGKTNTHMRLWTRGWQLVVVGTDAGGLWGSKNTLGQEIPETVVVVQARIETRDD